VVSYPGEALPSALARLLQSPDIPADLDPQWVRLLTSMTATDPAARPPARETAMSLGEITLAEKGRQSGDPAAFPPDEAGRMEAVHRYQILEGPRAELAPRLQTGPGHRIVLSTRPLTGRKAQVRGA